MVPEPSTASAADHSSAGDGSSVLFNALVGGVVGVVLAFVPFSPLLGGAVAGYLEGPDSEEWLLAGLLAGVVTLIPLFFVGLFALFVFGFFLMGSGLAVGVFALFALVFGAVYTVGLSVVGAYLGRYVAGEV